MSIREWLLGEFDHEMSNTRKTLERVPGDKWDWKPHPKSGSLGWLAAHIATLPTFTTATINLAELEITGSSRPKVEHASQLLPVFAKCREEARQALERVTDEQLRQTWTLKWNGKVIFSMSRYHVLRSMCFNHLIHHRAQLTMYLRALDLPVPALYGPSADEQSV